jgi:hypothetical protein
MFDFETLVFCLVFLLFFILEIFPFLFLLYNFVFFIAITKAI